MGEGVDSGGEALGDVVVSEVFAHDGGVFALDEGVVVGLAGAGLGELADMQLVEQRRDPLVDVLGAIVGVESLDWKGIRLEVRFEHGEEKAFGDGLDAADVLVLCDRVDGVDVIHPLDAIEVALVNGVDAQEAGLPVGPGLAALANGDRGRPGLEEMLKVPFLQEC